MRARGWGARWGGTSGDGVAGEGEFFDDVVDDGFGAHAFGFAFEGEDHAVAESGDGDGVDVFLGDVEAAFEEGAGASGGEDGLGLLGRIGSVLPLFALVAGLLFINSMQNEDRARELAEVDAALLTDDLPPAAFADPGFLQFLKTDL